MLELLSDPAVWMSLATLTALEIVLGIDNLIFLNIVAGRVSPERRQLARQIGLALALGMRIGLLFSLSWVMTLTTPLFELFDLEVSARDMILFFGGLFLFAKATIEIHHTVEGAEEHAAGVAHMSFGAAVTQIALLDIVFSLDSVITAVGMANDIEVMITAVTISMIVMLAAARSVGRFIERNPTVKMLALSFLLLVGMALVADGLHFHIPKGYLYFAIAFSCLVEGFNILARRRRRRAAGLRTQTEGSAS
jgi:predicted tellurium resistance membrane protein TerC